MEMVDEVSLVNQPGSKLDLAAMITEHHVLYCLLGQSS